MGAKLGVCKKCTLIFCSSDNLVTPPGQAQTKVKEAIIQQLDAVLDHIISKKRVGKAAVSMSLSYGPGKMNPAFYQSMSTFLETFSELFFLFLLLSRLTGLSRDRILA